MYVTLASKQKTQSNMHEFRTYLHHKTTRKRHITERVEDENRRIKDVFVTLMRRKTTWKRHITGRLEDEIRMQLRCKINIKKSNLTFDTALPCYLGKNNQTTRTELRCYSVASATRSLFTCAETRVVFARIQCRGCSVFDSIQLWQCTNLTMSTRIAVPFGWL